MGVTVTLPDGKPLQLDDGATGADAAAAIGPGLARAALAVQIAAPNGDGGGAGAGEVRDLARPLPDGAGISIVTAKSGRPALDLIRHDAAHVLATRRAGAVRGREDLDRAADRGTASTTTSSRRPSSPPRRVRR